jgi:hypothetical protein
MKIGVGADGAAVDVQPPDADGKAASSIVSVADMLYNGATHDRQRGNTEGTLLASAARTVTVLSAMQTNHNARGVIVILNVTAASGTGGLSVAVWDGIFGVVFLSATTPATAIGVDGYELYPGSTGAVSGNLRLRVSGALPRTWQAVVTVGDASSYTYSLNYSLVV